MTEIVPFVAEDTVIDGLVRLTMKQATDERGTVREFYRESAFTAAGLPSLGPWVQVNVTETARGAIRGMHGEQMQKLVAVAAGEAFGAWVDTRESSATFGETVTATLRPGIQMLVPPGVCNGFQAVSDPTQYVYCFDQEWRPGMTGVALSPLDPDLAIPWPIDVDVHHPGQLSVKDRSAPTLASLRSTP